MRRCSHPHLFSSTVVRREGSVVAREKITPASTPNIDSRNSRGIRGRESREPWDGSIPNNEKSAFQAGALKQQRERKQSKYQQDITSGRAQATSHQNSPGTGRQRAQATSHHIRVQAASTGNESSHQGGHRQPVIRTAQARAGSEHRQPVITSGRANYAKSKQNRGAGYAGRMTAEGLWPLARGSK